MDALTKSDIKELRQLARSSSARKEQSLVVVEGFRAIVGAQCAGAEFKEIFVTAEHAHRCDGITSNMRIVEVSTIEKIATTTSAQEALAICKMPSVEIQDIVESTTPLFVLDHVSDPGNVGTIARSCVAFGIESIVTISGCDPYHPKVVRSSAGSIFGVTIYPAYEYELEHLLESRTINVAEPSSSKPLEELQAENKSAYVFGSEAHGIKTDFFRYNTQSFHIRMAELCESLNVAMSATIVAHHISNI